MSENRLFLSGEENKYSSAVARGPRDRINSKIPTISISLSDAKCSPICRAQTCVHSGIEPSRSAKAFLQVGPKSSKKIRIFHHFEILRPYISQNLLKTEAYKQYMQKRFIPPLSNCRICIAHGVLQGGPKIE